MRTKRLGDMLIELGLLTNDQLKQALEFQAKEKDRLGTTLVKHNFITEHQLIDALRMQLGIDYIDLTKTDITPEMSSYVPKNLAGACFQGPAVSGNGGSIKLHGCGGSPAYFQEAYCADDRF